MALTIDFVVEDGTAKEDATSYVSIEDFISYWANRGVDYSSEEDDTIAIWLNLASQYADTICKWGGYVADTLQALGLPRYNLYDVRNRQFIDSDVIPTAIKNGVCELAAIRQADNFDNTISTGLKSESYGPVSVTYSSDSGSAKVLYPTAWAFLSRYTRPAGLRGIPT